jgi:hypothetical protein
VTTKVNLIHGKKNAHSSEEFSGEWAFLYNGVLYMSLATFSMEVAIFRDEVDSFSIKVAIWGKKFLLFYGKFPHFPHFFPHFPYNSVVLSAVSGGCFSPQSMTLAEKTPF